MRIFRIAVLVIIVTCVAPLLILIGAMAAIDLAGCTFDWDMPLRCSVRGVEIGPGIDVLLQLGAVGLLTWLVAMLAFAFWTLVELAAIVLRRSRPTRLPPTHFP